MRLVQGGGQTHQGRRKERSGGERNGGHHTREGGVCEEGEGWREDERKKVGGVSE